jgi:cell division topological specificity factor
MSACRPRAPTSSPNLRDEILQVIAKHVQVDNEKVNVRMERGAQVSTLAVDIEIPFDAGKKAA